MEKFNRTNIGGSCPPYPEIDMMRTGRLIRQAILEAGYTVRDIQGYLRLSCPQSVYRWFRGETLPSLDHLLAIARLLRVRMEDLIVIRGEEGKGTVIAGPAGVQSRCLAYYRLMRRVA